VTSIPTALAEQLIPNDSPFIFAEPAEGHFRRHWLKAVRLAQTPAHVKPGHAVLMVTPTPHDLRHTHAVLMLTEGHMNLIALAARLGHSSSRTTERYYAHFADDQMSSLGTVAARAVHGFMV
jgi:integrase